MSLGITLENAIQLVSKTFHVEPYKKQEICDVLEVTSVVLDETSLSERSKNGSLSCNNFNLNFKMFF